MVSASLPSLGTVLQPFTLPVSPCVRVCTWLHGYIPGGRAVMGLVSDCAMEAGRVDISEGFEAYISSDHSLAPNESLAVIQWWMQQSGLGSRPLAAVLGLSFVFPCPHYQHVPTVWGDLSTDSFLNSGLPKKAFHSTQACCPMRKLKPTTIRITRTHHLHLKVASYSCHSPGLSSSVFKLFSLSVFFPLSFVLN